MGLAHRYSTDGEHKIKKEKMDRKKKERKDICIVYKKKKEKDVKVHLRENTRLLNEKGHKSSKHVFK